MRRWTEVLGRMDWPLTVAAVSLTAIGLLAIFGIAISHESREFFQFNKQLLGFGIGALCAFGLAWVDYRQLRVLSLPIYASGLFMLLLALLVGTTYRSGGKWFVLGSLSFQPVEFAKVIFVVFFASFLSRHARPRLSWTAFLGSVAALAGYVIPVLLQPDFGSAMVMVFVWLAMVVFCGMPRHAWWILLVTLGTVSTLLWTVGLKPYQRDRITSFVNPAADPRGAAYNVTQARIAIGSGGWLGKGVGEGSQARLRFLPEASTDFIFAVLGEELGFLGIGVVLSIFAFLLMRYIRIATMAPDAFGSLVLIGLASIVFIHVLINAGMNLGIFPVTGIPLPYLSAAASSLLMMFVSVGLAQAVAVQSKGTFLSG